jgi:hypothetical protein
MLKKILTLLIFVILSVSAINFAMATDPLNPDDANDDPDGDELKNWEEYLNGTDPNNADSDNDGVPDGWEIFNDMDPADPKDAHEDLDYQVSEGSFNGEIDAQFSAVRHAFDIWPAGGSQQVAADLHYDNYEEYYRAFSHVASEPVDKDYPNAVSLGGVWVIFAPTEPTLPDSDADNILDPDDFEPHNFANDGTSFGTHIYQQDVDYDRTLGNNYKIKTVQAAENLRTHDTVLIDSDMFTSIRF